MPAKRELSMRQLRYVLRLHYDEVSAREIGRRLGVARSTIQDNLKRATAAGLSWPLPDDVTDDVLELRLFGRVGTATGQRRRIEPDWAALARELKRPAVTMTILWEEYRETHPDGYGYSRFCDLLRGFERRLTPVMRQHHVAGEKVFVDYSGKRIGIADPETGEIREAEIFVGVLGASNLTYAEATWTQQLIDWTGAHVRMFRFFGGAPRLLVPGVNKASFYDPEINRTYGALAAHYGVGVLPARPGKPRDKAKVEAGVRFAQTCILGRLRRLTFFSLAECNAAIALAMQRMNERPMRKLGLSRRELFDRIERDALVPLPADDWEFAEWGRARVNLDYHIEVHDFLYSVPHALIRAEVEVRATARMIEVFHRGQRVAAHQRRYAGRKHGTDPEHMPSSHRRYAEWSPERFRRWAAKIGPNTEGLISAVLASRPHPEEGFRTCLGILRSYRGLDAERLEAVSARAVELGVLNYKGVAALLARKAAGTATNDRPPALLTTPICAVPATSTDRNSSCSLIPPSTSFTRSASMDWQRGSRTSNTSPRRAASSTPNGSDCCSNTRRPCAARSSSRPEPGLPNCATAPASRTSTIKVRAASTARCSSSSRPATGSPSAATCRHRRLRPGQELARLRARAQGVPGKHRRPLRPRSQALRRSGRRPRLSRLRPAPAHARPRQAAHPRRLGTRGAQRRSGPRSPRNRRGSLRQGLDRHHKPGPRGPLA